MTTRRRAVWVATIVATALVPASPARGEPVMCRGEVATIVGTAADDVIQGTDGRDVIAGLDGADTIYGGPGADLICGDDGDSTALDGGPGDDTLVIVTQGYLDGGPGADLIDASAAPPGTTRLGFAAATQGVEVNLHRQRSRGLGRDTVLGIADVDATPFDDRIVGDDLANTLNSGAGNDTVSGGSGNDFLSTSSGVDMLTGGQGKDTLTGGSGDDVYRGAGGGDGMYEFNFTGNDTMTGGPGDDLMVAGYGDDAIFGGGGEDVADGGSDATTLGDFCDVFVEQRTSCER